MNKEILEKIDLIKGTVRTVLPQLCKKNNIAIIDYLIVNLDELEDMIKNELV